MFGRSRKARQSTSFLLFASSPSRDAFSVGQERVYTLASSSTCAQSRLPTASLLESSHGLGERHAMLYQAASWHCYLAAGPSRPLVKLTLQVPVGGVRAIAQGPPGQAATGSFLFLFFLHCSLHLAASTLTAVRLLSPRRLIIISWS
jgi:hypothetical protein